MFRQENLALSDAPSASNQSNVQMAASKKPRKKLYALLAGLIVIVVIVAALLIPQGSGSTIPLNLNYTVGECMVYDTTNIVTNQIVNTSLSMPGVTNSQSYNSTLTLDVIGSNIENYTINETITDSPDVLGHLPSLTLNVSKTSYYDNFMAPGGPAIFYNISNNPALSTYLAKASVNVGDVWQIPVNTGNASLGLTGELTLNFTGLQDFTVPAGTYKTFKIDITSNKLNVHSDGSSLIRIPDNMTLQLSGTTYLEQGTCRLIKANLTQETTFQTIGVEQTSVIYTEKTLVGDTKP